MNQPVYVRQSMTIAVISALEAMAPVALVPLILYVITRLQEVVFEQFWVALMVISALLSLLILRPRHDETLVSMLSPFS